MCQSQRFWDFLHMHHCIDHMMLIFSCYGIHHTSFHQPFPGKDDHISHANQWIFVTMIQLSRFLPWIFVIETPNEAYYFDY